jgi:hypothetical protein
MIAFFRSVFFRNSDFGFQFPYFCVLCLNLSVVAFDELFNHFSELHNFLLHRLVAVFDDAQFFVQLIVGR